MDRGGPTGLCGSTPGTTQFELLVWNDRTGAIGTVYRLAQTVHGALPTLLVGFSAGALVIALGSVIGGFAGHFRWLD